MTGDITWATAFFAGLLSFLSPCVLPLVPPYLGFLAGATIEELAGDDESEKTSRWRVVGVAVAFVIGFSTIFIALGATASAIGRLLLSWSYELGIAAGVVIILMGLHFLGAFRIGLLYREARFQTSGVKAGPIGAYILGLAFAFGWAPCIGPILSVILAMAGAKESLSEGAMMLAIYSAGLGIPFIAAAFFAGHFLGFLKRFRRQFDKVEKAMGLFLVLTGVMFLTGQMQQISFWLLETFPVFQTIG